MSNEEYIEYSKKRIIKTCSVNKNGCWIWQGYKCEPRKQYALTTLAITKPRRKILSHRASYTLFKGEIPEEMQVLHSCDVPLCCNPDHLHLGTARDNMNEMKKRGRERKAIGEKNHKSKLTEEKVIEIRKLHNDGYTHRQINKLFGIGISTVHYITTRKTWRNI